VTATAQAFGATCPDHYSAIPIDSYYFDENWAVITCTPDDDNYTDRFTLIIHIDGQVQWTIPFTSFDWADRPLADLQVYRWSADGAYVYLKPTIYMVDFFSPAGSFVSGKGLYRFNLQSGQLETILSPDDGYLSYSISPNDRYLAYSYPVESNIVRLLDLETLEEVTSITIDPVHTISGRFAWAFDSSQLVFAAGVQGFEDYEAGISLFKFTLSNNHIQPILLNDVRMLIPMPSRSGDSIWSEDGIIDLRSISIDHWDENWSLNVRDATLIFSSPTPTSSPTIISTPIITTESETTP
jgi:hypothetical protein